MWTPLITLISLVLISTAAVAAAVALATTDRERSERAVALLKIVLGAILGGGGVLAAATRLHQAGLL
ncbi:hypothetical protein SAMN04488564_11721 [Lentzea waywayandensis]|uniref:Uncharacterized protein n=1 Tax=Lentzea waywayandensis TaxID=84724 RepID=A0A1I6FH51_9PSEU|nr:hypothetical protein [Lentzea waywayandensis]SFR29097.1 hypothetical protein SAMN04488564_11721 [Lentzea waywayandensis]